MPAGHLCVVFGRTSVQVFRPFLGQVVCFLSSCQPLSVHVELPLQGAGGCPRRGALAGHGPPGEPGGAGGMAECNHEQAPASVPSLATCQLRGSGRSPDRSAPAVRPARRAGTRPRHTALVVLPEASTCSRGHHGCVWGSPLRMCPHAGVGVAALTEPVALRQVAGPLARVLDNVLAAFPGQFVSQLPGWCWGVDAPAGSLRAGSRELGLWQWPSGKPCGKGQTPTSSPQPWHHRAGLGGLAGACGGPGP